MTLKKIPDSTADADGGMFPGLTRRQDRFARAYAISGNATQAARDAGYSPESADVIAAQNLGKARVAAAVSYYEKPLRESARAAAEQAGLDAAMVAERTANICAFDIRKLYGEGNRLLQPEELDAATASCISGVQMRGGVVVGYKILDKNTALDRASRMLGAFEQDNSQSNPIGTLLASLGRSAFPVTK